MTREDSHDQEPGPDGLARRCNTLRISYDSDVDFLWALAPGEVIDGQMDDEIEELEDVDAGATISFKCGSTRRKIPPRLALSPKADLRTPAEQAERTGVASG